MSNESFALTLPLPAPTVRAPTGDRWRFKSMQQIDISDDENGKPVRKVYRFAIPALPPQR